MFRFIFKFRTTPVEDPQQPVAVTSLFPGRRPLARVRSDHVCDRIIEESGELSSSTLQNRNVEPNAELNNNSSRLALRLGSDSDEGNSSDEDTEVDPDRIAGAASPMSPSESVDTFTWTYRHLSLLREGGFGTGLSIQKNMVRICLLIFEPSLRSSLSIIKHQTLICKIFH